MIIKPEADRDIAEAVLWYDGRREGLGEKFEAALDQVLRHVESMPRLHRVIYQNVRRAMTPGFPFGVYYRIEGEEVVVLAVVHARRDPGRWQSRV